MGWIRNVKGGWSGWKRGVRACLAWCNTREMRTGSKALVGVLVLITGVQEPLHTYLLYEYEYEYKVYVRVLYSRYSYFYATWRHYPWDWPGLIPMTESIPPSIYSPRFVCKLDLN